MWPIGVQELEKAEESIRSPGLELQVIVSCCVGARNRKRMDPLQEQNVLTAEPSLQFLRIFTCMMFARVGINVYGCICT